MSSNKCQQCGLVNFPGALACRRCNTPVSGRAEGEAPPIDPIPQETFNDIAAHVELQPEQIAAYPAHDSLTEAAPVDFRPHEDFNDVAPGIDWLPEHNPPYSPDVPLVVAQPAKSVSPTESNVVATSGDQQLDNAPDNVEEDPLQESGSTLPDTRTDRKLRTGQAASSLVLGILGLFSAGLIGLGSLIGLVLGIGAVRKAKNEPAVYGGKGIAIGGIVTNSLGLLSIIPIALLTSILIPNAIVARVVISEDRIAENEELVLRHIIQIMRAEGTFQASRAGGGQRFGDLHELIDEGLIPVDSAQKHGYNIKIRVQHPKWASENTVHAAFEVVGVPESYGWSGRKSFYTSELYILTSADKNGEEATSADDPIK